VRHVPWRDDEAEEANALAYERGAGAFLGAALRRRPRHGARLLKLRSGHQVALFRREPGRPPTWGLRSLVAFSRGLVFGVRLRPLRPVSPRPGPDGPETRK